MHNLRMELHRIELFGGIFHSRNRAISCFSGYFKIYGYLIYVIRMAHPTNRFLRNTVKQFACGINGHLNFTVFVRACLNNAAQCMRHKLSAVANSHYRDAEFKKFLLIQNGILTVNTFRPARKYYTAVSRGFNFLYRSGIRTYFRINIIFSDSSCNQLIVLSAKVKHQNLFHFLLLQSNIYLETAVFFI